jgi:hypothetical protein
LEKQFVNEILKLTRLKCFEVGVQKFECNYVLDERTIENEKDSVMNGLCSINNLHLFFPYLSSEALYVSK